jgi:hypothetical protein
MTAAIGGLVLGKLLGRNVVPEARAADGDSLIIGSSNTGNSPTSLTSNPAGVSGIPAFEVLNPGFDVAAIQGWATTNTGPSKGVVGRTNSGGGTGIFGFNTAENGPAIAVSGVSFSTSGIGVHGHPLAESGNTIGVVGLSESPEGVGVQAINASPGGLGLQVFGRSRFNTIIDGTVPAGADGVTVADGRVNPDSEVMVMLTGDPGSVFPPGPSAAVSLIRNGLSWVGVGSGSFTVHLLGRAGGAVPFRAFIVEKSA